MYTKKIKLYKKKFSPLCIELPKIPLLYSTRLSLGRICNCNISFFFWFSVFVSCRATAGPGES